MKHSAFLRSVHYTESILLAQADIVKKKSGKFQESTPPSPDSALTRKKTRDKIARQYAGVVELADMLNLGAVTSVKVFREVLQ